MNKYFIVKIFWGE